MRGLYKELKELWLERRLSIGTREGRSNPLETRLQAQARQRRPSVERPKFAGMRA